MTSFSRSGVTTLASHTYDVLIVGGGINGVAVARDAATRGLSVALIERGDLAVGTSAWNSRLIHGGLRYLEHGEIPLVYESLHDRESLLRIAGHLVEPLPFLVPLYKHNHLPGWMFRCGLLLYDFLSFGKSVPMHRYLRKKSLNTEFPGMEKQKLSGGVHYYDGQVTFPERLVLETAISAADAGAVVGTYVEATALVREGNRVVGVEARDLLSDETATIRASVVVNAAGPWVDELGSAIGLKREIGGTTGTHFIVDAFPGAPDACIYFEARRDNRAVLVIPWNGRYLIGTTDDRFEGDPGAVRGTAEEVEYLLEETNQLIPTANLTKEDILFTYTGVRPLPYRPGVKSGKIPRSHLILTHGEAPGLVTIVGGKLTPHISLGRDTVNKVAKVLGRSLPASGTKKAPLPGAFGPKWSETTAQRASLADTLPWSAEINARLARVYGATAQRLGTLAANDASLLQTFGTGRGALTAAEIVHAVEAEGASTIVDIIHRRSMVGLEPNLGEDIALNVAEFMRDRFGWDETRVASEVSAHDAYITRLLGGTSRDAATLEVSQ